MTNFTLVQQRQQLEKNYRQSQAQLSLQHQVHQQFVKKFTNIWRQLSQFLVMNAEPRIWTETAPTGETVYRIFDPVNRQSFTAQSETALRAWLETRYYR